jgi:hypothetical protein
MIADELHFSIVIPFFALTGENSCFVLSYIMSSHTRSQASLICAFSVFIISSFALAQTSVPAALYSVENCRLEVRYLSRQLGAINLKGPPIITDGWHTNIAEAEWPFLASVYFGHACLNLAEAEPRYRQELLPEVRWVLHALQQPRLSGFVKEHFGEPFPKGLNATAVLPPVERSAVFVHGHFLYLGMRYQQLAGDRRFAPVLRQVAEALARDLNASPHGMLKSYSTMWWLTDNFAAYAGLVHYDRVHGTQFSAAKEKFIREIKAHYLSPSTGLFATYVDADKQQALQGPRGISLMYGLHYLKEFAPEFAQEQYTLARKHFYRSVLGLGAMLEFPAGEGGREDIDSGPVVFGLGPSASGFGIGAAAVMQDRRTVDELLRSLSVIGLPVREGEGIRYAAMPMVGQAVILFGKTQLLRP